MKRAALVACVGLLLCAGLWAQDTGPVTIGGVTYDYVDPGDPFEMRPVPPQDWEAPKPTVAETASGLMVYVTPDPGDYKPWRIPKADEHVAKLSTFLTPGEDEPVYFGLWALADIAGLSVSVDAPDAPLIFDVRHEHFWPQRTGWRSRQWYITPELLLPCADGLRTVPTANGLLEDRPFDIAQGETAALWLTITAPDGAKPGTYAATVRVSSTGRPDLLLPLSIEVLPFRLVRPDDRYWLLYADAARWATMSKEQVDRELRDFARHGITGLVESALGSADTSDIKSGKAGFDASHFNDRAAQCLEAGLPGPHVCSFGGMAPRINRELGLNVNLNEGDWPQAISDGVTAVAKAAVEATKDAPARWYFYGVDEPSGDNTYAIQEYVAWRAGGAETYATFYRIDFLEKASEYLTAPCFVTGLVASEEAARRAREECEKTGAEFWWYGTGSYVNPFPQEGYMFHNRYGSGYFFWKTGAKSAVAWTFCRPHEDVFNDFDGSRANAAEPKEQATTYPHFTKANDWTTYQGAIPTLAWESIREGVDDYLYLHNLKTLIGRAKASEGEAPRLLAEKAETAMAELLDAIPWSNPMGGVTFETSLMQKVRRAIADLTIDLEASLEGRPASGAQAARTRFGVRVTLVESEPSAQPLPTMPLVPVKAAPVIDGKLDDACWRAVPVADTFRYSQSGRPSKTATRAQMAYDDRALYVAFDCAEPSMDRLVAKQTGHDTPMVWVDDGIEFFIGDISRERYAHVIVNTNGSVYDESGQDPAWNPAIEVGVEKAAEAWRVEFSIPWTDLAAAGVQRAPVMTANLCRNRFTAPREEPHSAWSCPFGGYHNPARFGMVMLQEGPVAVTGLSAPTLWGRQTLGITLRNLTDEPQAASVQVRGGGKEVVALQPGASRDVRIPLNLRRSGSRRLTVKWGQGDTPSEAMHLGIAVPEPIEVPPGGGFVEAGEIVEMPIRVNIAPGEREKYEVRLAIDDGAGRRTMTLPAKPGVTGSVSISATAGVRIAASLINSRGETVGSPARQTLFPLEG